MDEQSPKPKKSCNVATAPTQEELDVQAANIALQALGEHFDNVQLLCSRYTPEDGGTFRMLMGKGDFYARLGLAHHFINIDEANTTAFAIREEN